MMNRKKVLGIVLGVSFIVAIGGYTWEKIEEKRLSQTQHAYFEAIKDDIKKRSIDINSIKKSISGSKLKNIEGFSSFVDGESNKNLSYKTNNYQLENGSEVLTISCLGNDSKSLQDIESISYDLKINSKNEQYLNMYYSKLKNEKINLNVGMSLQSLDGQKNVFELLNNENRKNEMYEIYYKVAKSIEDNIRIEKNNINKFLENKNFEVSEVKDSKNAETYIYTLEQDKLKLFITYDKESEKFKDVLVESYDENYVSMCYYKDYTPNIQVWNNSDDLNKHKKIVEKLIK